MQNYNMLINIAGEKKFMQIQSLRENIYPEACWAFTEALPNKILSLIKPSFHSVLKKDVRP